MATIHSSITAITATLYVWIDSKCQAADYTGLKAVTTNLWITSTSDCVAATGAQREVHPVSVLQCLKHKGREEDHSSNNGPRAETWWSWVSPFRLDSRMWAVRGWQSGCLLLKQAIDAGAWVLLGAFPREKDFTDGVPARPHLSQAVLIHCS